jgi:phage tail sheath protein FI
MTFFHGVRTQELPTKVYAVREVDSALPLVVAPAPVHTLADYSDVVNNPKLIFSYSEFINTFGAVPAAENEPNYGLSEFARIYFTLYNMGPMVAVNVFDPATHKTAVSDEAKTFVADKITLIHKFPNISSIVVTDSGGTITYTTPDDYTVAVASDGTCTITRVATGDILADASVLVDYDYADVSKVGAADIVGSYNAETERYTGLECSEEIFPRFGKVIGSVVCPGWSVEATVAVKMISVATLTSEHFKAMAFLDIPDTVLNATDAVEYKSDYGSEFAVMCWPKVLQGEAEEWLSCHAAALCAKVDWENDGIPYESPSNKTLSISGPSIVLGLPKANYLNEQGIVTVNRFMTGWKLWGNRTSAFPESTDIKDVFIPCRRMANFIENNLVTNTWQKVDDPVNRRLIETVKDTTNIWLNGYVGMGQLLGARVEFLEQENPVTDLLNGKIKFHIYYLAPPPAEDIVFVLEVDTSYFSTLFA